MVMRDAVMTNAMFLRAGFEHAIRIAMHEAMRRTLPKRPEEPDIVAMLVLEGTRYLAATLGAVLRSVGIDCRLSSVFCHQRPEVVFVRGRCELGDILFVHRHHARDPEDSTRTALLLQAKKTHLDRYEVGPGESQQLRLYTEWPRFTYRRSGPSLNGQQRDLQPKSAHPGAQYLLIDDLGHDLALSGMLGLPGTHCMAVAPARIEMSSQWSLADALVQFFAGLTGRSFLDDPDQDGSDWSRVVHDLLAHARQHVFNRTRSGVNRASRRADAPWSVADEDGACRIAWGGGGWSEFGRESGDELEFELELAERFAPFASCRDDRRPPNHPDHDAGDGDGGGVSVVLIETRDGERQ